MAGQFLFILALVAGQTTHSAQADMPPTKICYGKLIGSAPEELTINVSSDFITNYNLRVCNTAVDESENGPFRVGLRDGPNSPVELGGCLMVSGTTIQAWSTTGREIRLVVCVEGAATFRAVREPDGL